MNTSSRLTPLAPPQMRLPAQLSVPAPSWTLEYDVVVVGSGAAGLAAALTADAGGRRVLLLTKDQAPDGSTSWAQGGLAAVLDPADSQAAHVRDTLTAGAGLCDEPAVRTLIAQAPESIRWLEELGARFDRDGSGARALTREGGHSARRIVHAGGDASGAEVSRTLIAALGSSRVAVLEHALALDALIDQRGQVVGVSVLRTEGGTRSVGHVLARAVVVATGGVGQAFAVTTNPAVVTGDGLALAARAGAVLADVEFVQFHPTVLWTPRASGPGSASAFLISEAVRGEGAVLVDATGARVMDGAHPLADLAPRDVVAATMHARMREAPGGVDDHLWLDATGLGAELLARRFPTILAACRAVGIDPVTDPIPVAPAAHYFCGGVRADMDGRTSLPGLFAVGEVACTGVQGANRLASNSITEGLVTGRRLGRALARQLPPPGGPPASRGGHDQRAGFAPWWRVDPATRQQTAELTGRYAGVLREPSDLVALLAHLDQISPARGQQSSPAGVEAQLPTRAEVEATNLHTITALIATAALARTESRGCHRRADVVEPQPAWERHQTVALRRQFDGRWATMTLQSAPVARAGSRRGQPRQEVA